MHEFEGKITFPEDIVNFYTFSTIEAKLSTFKNYNFSMALEITKLSPGYQDYDY